MPEAMTAPCGGTPWGAAVQYLRPAPEVNRRLLQLLSERDREAPRRFHLDVHFARAGGRAFPLPAGRLPARFLPLLLPDPRGGCLAALREEPEREGASGREGPCLDQCARCDRSKVLTGGGGTTTGRCRRAR